MRKDALRDLVIEQLGALRGLDCRAIFNGYGFWCGTKFFAIVGDGRLFFRVNDDTRPAYEKVRSGPFRTRGGRIMRDFMEVPADIIKDQPQILDWAEQAILAAQENGKGRKRKIRIR